MSDSSASTEPVTAESGSSRADASSSSEESRGNSGRVKALIVGVLVGLGIGLGVGLGVGNAARKRIDRFSHY